MVKFPGCTQEHYKNRTPDNLIKNYSMLYTFPFSNFLLTKLTNVTINLVLVTT